ncbi:MAG: methyltransferase domain-containing protein [Vicinamibacterales bacterium]
MSAGRLWRRSALLFVPGAIVAVLWAWWSGWLPALRALTWQQGFLALGLPLLTIGSLVVRFFRWHYLLRQAGVVVPIRPSMAIYLASLVGIATPASLGELSRAVLMRRRFDVPFGRTAFTWFIERLLDVSALAVLALATGPSSWVTAALVGVLALVGAAWVASVRAAHASPHVAGVVRDLNAPGVVATSLVMSLVAWLPTCLLLPLAGASLGAVISPLDGLRIFSTSTLAAAASLVPAGVGVTGSVEILQLQALGLDGALAVQIVSLTRAGSVGVGLLVGTALLLRELGSRVGPAPADAGQHFDDIAEAYQAQWSPHVWSRLLERKVGLTSEAVGPPRRDLLGLDTGCGLGIQSTAMRARGYRVVGVDLSHNLLRHARRQGVPVACGSAACLPFPDATFDFAFVVGVLHHLPTAAIQEQALAEIARVLKPGGHLVVHETNAKNPLFRFYMGYVFPLLKEIDEGIELWVSLDRLASHPGFALERTSYYTFSPDFLPRALSGPVHAIEAALERSRFREYSVHYAAVLTRTPRAGA